jgi:hypothetical protein
VLRVAAELVTQHRFDGDALARSYGDLVMRGHLRGHHLGDLARATGDWQVDPTATAKNEILAMVEGIGPYAERARRKPTSNEPSPIPDYLALVAKHNKRH